MDTFLRLDLDSPVFFLDATAVELPGDPAGTGLFDKAMGFFIARIRAGDLGGARALAVIKVGFVDVRVPISAPGIAPQTAAEVMELARAAYELGAEGRQAQASARYQGAHPFARFA